MLSCVSATFLSCMAEREVLPVLAKSPIDPPNVWDTDHIDLQWLRRDQQEQFMDVLIKVDQDVDGCWYIKEYGLLYTIAQSC